MKIALIGHGAVAAIHARQLADRPEVQVTAVFGPDRKQAEVFAASHAIAHAGDSIEETLSQADAAIVCSPSPLHYRQGRECLEHGVHTLLEMPPCETAAEAEDLANIAEKNGLKVQGAHSARYLPAHRRIEEFIRSGGLGSVQQASFLRHLATGKRGWTDDALLHHSAHPLDLYLRWFGDLTPKSCIALPREGNPQSVTISAELPNGAPASIAVTYASHLPQTRMWVVGQHHTIETDGFSYLRSDLEELNAETPEVETYEGAIRDQDLGFIRACEGGKQDIEWTESIRLIRMVNRFHALLRG